MNPIEGLIEKYENKLADLELHYEQTKDWPVARLRDAERNRIRAVRAAYIEIIKDLKGNHGEGKLPDSG